MGIKHPRSDRDRGEELAGLLTLLAIVIVSVIVGVMIGLNVH